MCPYGRSAIFAKLAPMNRLLAVTETQDILPEYRDTPIGLLLEYHNLDRPLEEFTAAKRKLLGG